MHGALFEKGFSAYICTYQFALGYAVKYIHFIYFHTLIRLDTEHSLDKSIKH